MMKLRHLEVESEETIASVIESEGYSLEGQYILKSAMDSVSIYNSFLKCARGEILLFDAAGRKYCYNGVEKCTPAKVSMIFNSLEGNFAPCENDTTTLDDIRAYIQPLARATEAVDTAEFYLILYWSNFFGDSFGDEMEYYNTKLEESERNIKLLFVNTDLQESWGLEEGAKMKARIKYKGNKSAEVFFGDIPYKK